MLSPAHLTPFYITFALYLLKFARNYFRDNGFLGFCQFYQYMVKSHGICKHKYTIPYGITIHILFTLNM